jgi:hypothetical protein
MAEIKTNTIAKPAQEEYFTIGSSSSNAHPSTLPPNLRSNSTPSTSTPSPPDGPKYPPHFKKKPVPSHLKPVKFNSTSSLYIDSTISKPKNTELMYCIAEYFCHQIKMAPSNNLSLEQQQLRKKFEIFDEAKHPLTSKNVDIVSIPTVDTMQQFIKNIFKIGQLAHESLIMAVAYLRRIQENSGFEMYTYNWKRMILACMILASKVWEDQAVWNVDFLDLFPLATPHDLGQLEKKLLSLLSFDVSLKASQYAQIYFDLRAQSQHNEEHFAELKPLNKEGEQQLELRTQNYTHHHQLIDTKQLHRSSGSVDNITQLRSPRSILN